MLICSHDDYSMVLHVFAFSYGNVASLAGKHAAC